MIMVLQNGVVQQDETVRRNNVDTKYFQQALAEYCKKHPWDAKAPLTTALLSELLTRAQVLKDADRAAAQPETTA